MDYRKILLNELDIRQRKNSSYNLSSLARLLDIPPSRLSEIVRGKVGLSTTKAESIAKTLNFSEEETRNFLDLVIIEHGRSPREKEEAQKRINTNQNEFAQYDKEHFDSIADWYHHAIVEMIGLDPAKSPLDMAASLGLESTFINQAIQRLINLKVIQLENGIFSVPLPNRETSRDIPSEAIKRLNEQILDKAATELRLQSVDNRDYSIAFMTFNKSQMALAKERIKEFRRNFMKEFESAPGKDSVYSIGIQFFELTGYEEIEEEIN